MQVATAMDGNQFAVRECYKLEESLPVKRKPPCPTFFWE
ncbi:hypothetical protein POREN0001_0601 [Porphyromonas endodontalis ATCC 35406]|uniref:Uncharacterized protein n=1 Tax=Porphyromonas endodontalis (strain ATCC 35406 / DSM 24491 / JCM 8526 / CCUG 16442 / BCRC 14492 / NCTC 13058 / HG 370) TaxID=553175 RepID=C3J8T1_POREA|nr:hypothetical protein POREN0001_0601 [Porphyromonas endodontalis ATCC 35406]